MLSSLLSRGVNSLQSYPHSYTWTVHLRWYVMVNTWCHPAFLAQTTERQKEKINQPSKHLQPKPAPCLQVREKVRRKAHERRDVDTRGVGRTLSVDVEWFWGECEAPQTGKTQSSTFLPSGKEDSILPNADDFVVVVERRGDVVFVHLRTWCAAKDTPPAEFTRSAYALSLSLFLLHSPTPPHFSSPPCCCWLLSSLAQRSPISRLYSLPSPPSRPSSLLFSLFLYYSPTPKPLSSFLSLLSLLILLLPLPISPLLSSTPGHN